MPNRAQKEYEYITSAPALAAALRETDVVEVTTPLDHEFTATSLVPMYQVEASSATDEAAHAAHMVSEIAERLRRLADAYEAWRSFDAPAFFDKKRNDLTGGAEPAAAVELLGSMVVGLRVKYDRVDALLLHVVQTLAQEDASPTATLGIWMYR